MYPVLLHLGEIVEEGARRFPEKPAYSMGARILSYAELEKQSGQLANTLLGLKLKKEERVGILAERCIESFIMVYGTLRSGGVFVPLDPASPVDRIHSIIQDAGIEILLVTPLQFRKLRALNKLLNKKIHVVGISPEKVGEGSNFERIIPWDKVMDGSDQLPVLRFTSQQLAYIMYTSGSTGQPKGIMHTHRSGLAYAERSARLYNPGPTDRFASHAPLHFDISTFAYFTAPYCGVQTVVLSEGETKLPVSLVQALTRDQVNFWYAVPLALIQLLDPGIAKELHKIPMKWVLFGGEPFAPKYVRQLMSYWPDATFSNVYGPAEVNQCTFYNFTEMPPEGEPIPLGEVWADAEFLIRDPESGSPDGLREGELCINSTTCMQGYWNREELNSKSFITTRTPSGVAKRFYRTGDLVRFNKRGELVFKGRSDFQIKKRGYRIDLAEIESVALQIPEIAEAAAFSTADGDDKRITLTIRRTDPASFQVATLIAHCRKHLPTYAQPDAVYELEDFPRTSSGKIVRSSLEDWINEKNLYKLES